MIDIFDRFIQADFPIALDPDKSISWIKGTAIMKHRAGQLAYAAPDTSFCNHFQTFGRHQTHHFPTYLLQKY
ncbi:MAG: hypothetical protein NTY86_13655, partial [Deltaproteobacteria bacterium]|nr:hypothetical protein [Deltaproteobacteria bacterium]